MTVVKPLTADPENFMYRVWKPKMILMRSVRNPKAVTIWSGREENEVDAWTASFTSRKADHLELPEILSHWSAFQPARDQSYVSPSL